MDGIMIKCPYCGEEIKRGNGTHIRKCFLEYVKNFDEIEFKRLYLDEEKSIVDLTGIYNLPYPQIQKLLSYYNIPTRSVAEACRTKTRQKKYEGTMMRNYGTTHNFNKDCSSRQKWEKRLLETEGIVNVFQRKEVKEKIKATMLEKYGEDGIFFNRSKGNYLWYYIEKYGEEEGTKKFNEILKRKSEVNSKEYYVKKYGEERGSEEWFKHLERIGKSCKNNYGLNKKCEDVLQKYNIEYKAEYFLPSDKHGYLYDFLVGNLIIELNSVYWHCSPKKYKSTDIVKFPHGKLIKAQDKWDYDKEKADSARSKGYNVEIIWEDEFSEEKIIEVLKKYDLWK